MTEQTELTYYTILTNQGIQYEQECLNTSSEFHITHIAVGDGSGSATTPSKTQTGLIHEIARYPVSKEEVSITKGEYYATAEIPYSAGNFTIRELGGYNSAGKLVAVANFPPTNKQVQEEWDIHKVYVRMDLCRVNERTFPSVVNSDLAFVSAETFEREIDLKANKTLNNLSEYGNNRLHALKGYLDEGKVLTDAEGLAYVIKMAHSTFDSSKFTKVGTPTITDDGIYSDIDGSNYVSMSADFLSANTWKLTCPIPKIISTGWKSVFARYGVNCMQANFNNGNISMALSSDGSTWDIYNNVFALTGYDSTKDCLFILEFTGTSYIAYGIQDGTKLTGTTITSNSKLYNSSQNIVLGIGRGLSGAIDSSMDLKQISVYANGYPVFSGNKTGIDVIKDDNYTVVGTPTISADGIASGLDNSNYITCDCINTDGTVYIPVPNVASGFNGEYVNGCYKLYRNESWLDSRFDLMINTSNTVIVGNLFANTGIDYNCTKDKLVLRIDKNGYDYTVYYKYNDNDWALKGTYTKSVNPTGTSIYFRGGYNLDLNLYKNVVNGSVINQPCLKIPYTESANKYGSKIVYAIYRDRVLDAWEQNYSQRYYTLDEENGNYTLPAGGIYGMIENCLNANYPTTSEKEIITSWLAPDFANAISITNSDITSTSEYICPSNGWLYAHLYSGSGSLLNITINGTSTYGTVIGGNAGSNYNSSQLLPILLTKGDTVSVNFSNSSCNFSFIPCKGV